MAKSKPLSLPAVPVLDGDAQIVSQHLSVTVSGVLMLDQDFPPDVGPIQFPETFPLHLDAVSLAYKNNAEQTGPAWVGVVDLEAVEEPKPVPPQPAAIQVPAPVEAAPAEVKAEVPVATA